MKNQEINQKLWKFVTEMHFQVFENYRNRRSFQQMSSSVKLGNVKKLKCPCNITPILLQPTPEAP